MTLKSGKAQEVLDNLFNDKERQSSGSPDLDSAVPAELVAIAGRLNNKGNSTRSYMGAVVNLKQSDPLVCRPAR